MYGNYYVIVEDSAASCLEGSEYGKGGKGVFKAEFSSERSEIQSTRTSGLQDFSPG